MSHVLCSYVHKRARIVLKFFLVVMKYVDILSFEFEKDLSRGYGEIDVLLAPYVFITDAHVLCCYVRARARIDLKFFLVVREYGKTLSLKYEKDPSKGSGEIDVLKKCYRSVTNKQTNRQSNRQTNKQTAVFIELLRN